MRQSTVIFGVLIFAFIVFITMKGQLPAYMDLFKSKPAEEKKSGGGILSTFTDKLKKWGQDAAKSVLKSKLGD